MPKESGLDVATMLSVLRARKVALEAAIAGLEQLEASGETLSGTPLPPGIGQAQGRAAAVEPDSFFGMNATEAAKKYLGMAGRPQSVEQIQEALNRGGLEVSRESLFTILPRAAKGREVVKVGRSMWGLSAWYKRGSKPPRGD